MVEWLEQSYSLCHEITRRRAKNFYYPFLVLPRERRRALYAVYSFMRHCDDISDGGADRQTKQLMLGGWRALLADKGGAAGPGISILPAFFDSLSCFSIPADYFHQIIDGVEMDLHRSRYPTFDDLYGYCYRVASAVGMVCLHIFGYHSPEAFKHAEACGIAFQLTNILRDLQDDARRDRIYLPQEDLERFGYSEGELLKGVYNERFRQLMDFQTQRARRFYEKARPLISLVHRPSRPALASMMAIYRGILERIVTLDYQVFPRRVTLSLPRKAWIITRSVGLLPLDGGRPFPP